MLKILIVEDEDFERKAIKYLINKHYAEENFIVTEASNGKEALDSILLFKPDIVLMDINMPIMDGLEASNRIKKINNEIEIIILTAYDEFEFAVRAIKSGTSDYLVKPFTDSEFLTSLNVTIEKVKKKRQKHLNQLHIIENYDKAIPFIEKELITQILYGDFSECCKMEESRKILEIDNLVGCSVLVGSKDKYTFQENALTDLKNIFTVEFKKTVAARLLGDIIILIFDNNVESIIMSNKMKDIINQAKNYFIKQEGIVVEIGVGSIAMNIDEFSTSYSEARLELRNNLSSCCQDYKIQADNTTNILNEIENKISEKLIGEDLKGAMEETKELEDS
ncbi:MAG: response regulator, partial [Tissierella sp.]|nr:response regulator [Tissierella sp.]